MNRAYNEFDDIPASVHPMLYRALDDWGYEGFVMADDTGLPYPEPQARPTRCLHIFQA